MTVPVNRNDYFNELISRIKEIRASERRLYKKIRDIMALACDYNPANPDCVKIFKDTQHKIQYAITGKSAPETILERADSSKPNMGLTSWDGVNITIKDATTAKNYYTENEITELNNFINMYLDYAEDQFKRHQDIRLIDWDTRLNKFIQFHERNETDKYGTISRPFADAHARKQLEIYRQQQIEQ